MRNRNHPIRLTATLVIFILAWWSTDARAETSKVIHHFNSDQGSNPEGVVIGPDGGLYGATFHGSNSSSPGAGTIFELTHSASGRWLETKSYNVINLAENPNGNLIFDDAGDLFATTNQGLGDLSVCGCCLCGAFGNVIELSPNADGHGWHGAVIVDFYSPGFFDREASADIIQDGTVMFPVSGLTRDAEGNLYGVAVGADGLIDLQFLGAIYKLSPSAGGGWTLADGPFGEGVTSGPVVIDANGNLYGVSGPVNDELGSVWKVDSTGVLTTLYIFELSRSGNNPISQGGLVLDSAGNLYGTTQNGGAFNQGTVFKLKHNADGSWSERVLYSFDGTKGGHPTAGVIFDAAGNLYGEAYDGGDGNSGVVFKLSPMSGGHWKYTPLRSFHGPDGSGPSYGLSLDFSGNLYGTTWTGGAYGNGTVFEITP